jgi:very-short-patch-repair endonuclease
MKTSPEFIQKFFVEMGLPAPIPEYKFHEERKWRFDYAWPDLRIALEVEGGVWSGGRHTSAAGFVKDMEKYNAAAALGWRVLRCTPENLIRLATVDLIKRARCA